MIARSGIRVTVPTNATCLMKAEQAVLASEAGAKYVSFFYRRMLDAEVNYSEECSLYRDCGGEAQIIAGSIREPQDVLQALRSADIVTVPPKILWELPKHPKTEATIAEFDQAWREYIGG